MSEADVKTYVIGGRTWEQRPLVLAQFAQLIGILRGMPLPAAPSETDIILALGDRLALALAVALTPKKMWPLSLLYAPRRKPLAKVAAELARHMDAAQVREVIHDFFTCNPVASLSDEMKQAMAAGGIVTPGGKTASKTPSASSLEATPASGTPSSGDSKCDTSSSGSATAPAS